MPGAVADRFDFFLSRRGSVAAVAQEPPAAQMRDGVWDRFSRPVRKTSYHTTRYDHSEVPVKCDAYCLVTVSIMFVVSFGAS